MSTLFAHNQHVSPKDAPTEAVQQALKAMTADVNDRTDVLGRHHVEMIAVEKDYRHRLAQLLGDHGVDRLSSLRRRAYEVASPLRDQPASRKDVEALRRDHQQRKRELLTDLRVDAAALTALAAERRRRLAELIPAPPRPDGRLATLLRPLDLPSDIRAGQDATSWTIARAPYSDWSWYYTGWHNGFAFEPTLFLNSNSGLVGNRNYLFDNDASDFDHAQIEYNASIGFWYQMPDNARLDVYVEAQADVTLHHLAVIDEWGFSDAFSWQENYLAVKADGLAQDPWQKALTSWFKYDDDSEGNWTFDYIHHGTTRWAHLQTQNWFPKGSWVRINAGSTSWQRAAANDMEVYSDMHFQWFIRSVWVRPLF